MALNAIRYCILFLILCNIPSYLLAYFSPTLGSLSSYASSLLLLTYFFFTREKHTLLFPFVLLGLLYYMLSGLNFTLIDVKNNFLKDFLRFMIVVVCANEVVRQTNNKEVFYIFLIGGLSVIINAVVFPLAQAGKFAADYGRFSGFYLNPNFAGSICLIGYALSYTMKGKWKLIGQMVFTLAGILTFSRTFIVIWLVVSFMSIVNNRRNAIVPAIGALAIILVFVFSNRLTLNTERFEALQGLVGEEHESKTEVIKEDSRTQTWAFYYDMIFERPFLGHGYTKFRAKYNGLPGVHNSYLMVIGEAGFLPFLLIVGLYIYLVYKSFLHFKHHPEYFYLACVLALALMATHNYFNDFYNVLLSMFVFVKVRALSNGAEVQETAWNNKPIS